jgi:hypothetical protein
MKNIHISFSIIANQFYDPLQVHYDLDSYTIIVSKQLYEIIKKLQNPIKIQDLINKSFNNYKSDQGLLFGGTSPFIGYSVPSSVATTNVPYNLAATTTVSISNSGYHTAAPLTFGNASSSLVGTEYLVGIEDKNKYL